LRRLDKITPRSVFIGFRVQLFAEVSHHYKNNIDLCTDLRMNDTYSAWQMHLNEEEKNSAKRLLRRLRIALIIWVIVFIITIIWFSLSAMG
jgi:hypothetical protein